MRETCFEKFCILRDLSLQYSTTFPYYVQLAQHEFQAQHIHHLWFFIDRKWSLQSVSPNRHFLSMQTAENLIDILRLRSKQLKTNALHGSQQIHTQSSRFICECKTAALVLAQRFLFLLRFHSNNKFNIFTVIFYVHRPINATLIENYVKSLMGQVCHLVLNKTIQTIAFASVFIWCCLCWKVQLFNYVELFIHLQQPILETLAPRQEYTLKGMPGSHT